MIKEMSTLTFVLYQLLSMRVNRAVECIDFEFKASVRIYIYMIMSERHQHCLYTHREV